MLDPERGILLPAHLGFENGKDAFGRPQRINLSTVSEFYQNDILAVDRLLLPESTRKFNLFPFQRVAIKTCYDAQFTWLQMMRGGSKTYTLARFAIDYCNMVPGTPVVCTSASFRQALLLFDEALKIIDLETKNENSPIRIEYELRGEVKRNALESIIRFQNGSSLRALPMGDGSKIRGVRGGVLIIDEFYLINEEMYESHIKPFVGVKQGGRDSKIIHATTSYYQDCFAYKRLMQIASEVKRGNNNYAILDFNLKDLVDCGFPLDKAIWKDAAQHGDETQYVMTYFNIWPSSSSKWYEQRYIDEAQSRKHGVRIETEASGGTYFIVVDVAASEKGDPTEVIVWRYEAPTPTEPKPVMKAVWAYKKKGMRPEQRAWLVHELFHKFHPEFVIYDAHGAVGKDLRYELSKKELLVDGSVREVTPLVHHDAFNLSGHHVLIPVSVSDKAVKTALLGPRDGSEVRGEAGLRYLLHTKTRDFLKSGNILAPSSASEGNEDDDTVVSYDMTEIAALDVIREAFGQLCAIGPKKDKDGNEVLSQDGQLMFATRGGQHDDGAMCIVYGSIGLLRLMGYTGVGERSTPLVTAMDPNPKTGMWQDPANIQKLTFA